MRYFLSNFSAVNRNSKPISFVSILRLPVKTPKLSVQPCSPNNCTRSAHTEPVDLTKLFARYKLRCSSTLYACARRDARTVLRTIGRCNGVTERARGQWHKRFLCDPQEKSSTHIRPTSGDGATERAPGH